MINFHNGLVKIISGQLRNLGLWGCSESLGGCHKVRFKVMCFKTLTPNPLPGGEGVTAQGEFVLNSEWMSNLSLSLWERVGVRVIFFHITLKRTRCHSVVTLFWDSRDVIQACRFSIANYPWRK